MAWSWHERLAWWAWGCSAWVLSSERIKIWHLYYLLPEPYCLSNKHMWFLYTVNRLCCVTGSISFQSKLLPLFDLKKNRKTKQNDCLVLQGKYKLVCLWKCARMCMIAPPPPSPMVVVYGIARTTVIRSVIEAVFSISCMNHVGVVHLKEGEREKKPSIWKIPNNCS